MGGRYRKLELGTNLDEDGTKRCCQDDAHENCEEKRDGATGEGANTYDELHGRLGGEVK